jgi:Rap1a immunity proteins
MRIILAASFLIAMAQPGLCGPVTDFLKLHDEPLGADATETQIMGVQRGFIEANAFLTGTRREAPMYCQPETLSLTADQLVDMLRRGVKENPELDEGNLASALLAVMQHTFPCPQSSK